MRPVAVWWVKRDARLADNACLAEADSYGLDILPFFCFEPLLLVADDTSDKHVQAQWQAIKGLRNSLRQYGADLIIAHGEVIDKLSKLFAIIPFTHLFSHEEVGNAITYQRDKKVASWCRERGIVYREFSQSSVKRGGVDRDKLQDLWESRIVKPLPLKVPAIRQSPEIQQLAASTAFPNLRAFAPNRNWQSVSEADALLTLYDFLNNRGLWYRGGISSPNTAFTAGSRLSVHLAWGTLSVRQVWHGVQRRLSELDPNDPKTSRWKSGLAAFLSRLHWRDHFTQRLESEPGLEFHALHPAYRDPPYENDEILYAAWREGRTGYPLVDAVMRCLSTTGFVNFRMRAMVVSFACHNLNLDWRLIHPHLARVFRDYDPGIHLNQLQMQAGVVGLNTIRVYNPNKQLADWDPDCRFVKKWVPELGGLSPDKIQQGECAGGYPAPVSPIAGRSNRMKQFLYGIRRSPEAKSMTMGVYLKHGSRKKGGPGKPKKSKRPIQDSAPTLFDDLPPD